MNKSSFISKIENILATKIRHLVGYHKLKYFYPKIMNEIKQKHKEIESKLIEYIPIKLLDKKTWSAEHNIIMHKIFCDDNYVIICFYENKKYVYIALYKNGKIIDTDRLEMK